MFVPLVCALLYLVLSMRVLVDAALGLSTLQRIVRIRIDVGTFCLCIDKPVLAKRHGMPLHRSVKRAKPLLRLRWLICAVLRTLRWGQIDIRMQLGMQDAAVSAVACGVVQAILTAHLAVLGLAAHSDIRIVPDFTTLCCVVDARCIFSFSLGDIMIAAARAAVRKTKSEGFKWLSTPLRA